MPRNPTTGVYSAPSPAWSNGSAPYINADELNAISMSLENLKIANGGTGATSASEALTNLGGVSLASLQNKGSNVQPVYFDEYGVAQPIQTQSTALGSSFASGISNIYKFGKVVMITATTAEKANDFAVTSAIPDGYKPAQQAYGFAFGVNSTSAGADQKADGMVSINTSGTVHATLNGTGNYYIRFTIVYISE